MHAFGWYIALLIPALATAQVPAGLVDRADHDFGTVNQGARVVHTFEISNPLEHALVLSQAEATAPGMRVSFPASIAPSGRGKVTLEWDTTTLRGRVSGTALIAVTGASVPHLRLALTGVVQPLLEFRPMAAAYFSVWSGDAAERTITIVNNDDRPLEITRIEPQGTHFQASLDRKEKGKVYELRITVPAGTEPGRFMESVTLITDHPRHPALRIPVNVLVKSDVYVNPETVEFGRLSSATLRPGTVGLLTQTFLLKKRQGKLRIRSIESDVAPLAITQDPPNGESDIFRIDITLTKERLAKGSLKGTIRITTDDENFPVLAVPVTGEVE